MTNNNATPRVAVLMVMYNAQSYLGDCFSSLVNTDYPPDRWHVMVVDNASSDDTVAQLNFWKSHFQKLSIAMDIIESKENTAFAGGNNVAAAHAQQFNPDYLVLLNQDTVVNANWLKELVAAGESNNKIGIAQSLLLLHPQTNLINSLGNEIHFLGFGFSRGYRDPLSSITYNLEPRTYPEIPYASGAAMLVRNSLYQQIGLFDEKYFMYHEDLDLCWRARLKGWRVVLAPKSVVYHKYSFSKSITKYYFMERNRFITMLQNYHFLTLISLSPFLLLMELGLLFQAFRMGWWREKLRVYRYFFSQSVWHDILKKRKEVQNSRVISDKEATRLFTGCINYQEISSPLLTYVANPFFSAVWWIIRGIIIW